MTNKKKIKQKYKWKIFTKRWINVLIYLLICTYIFVLLDKITLFPLEKLFLSISADFSNFSFNIFLFGISMFLWGIIIKIGGAPFTLRNLVYFPTWLISILGTFLVLYLIARRYSYTTSFIFYCHSVIVVGAFATSKIFFWAYEFLFGDSKKKSNEIERSNKPQTFLEWVLSESPVFSKEDDKFERYPIAVNMSQQINEGKNLALVGDYGVGKSTTLNWMTDLLKNDTEEHNTVCKIDSWGRRHNELTSCLLEYGLRNLKSQIDVLSFVDIPEDFVKAISGGSFWGNLFRIAKRGITPIEVLSRLDDILFAHNEKLIFIIEDIDRNIDDELIQVELPSLLDRLSETDNLLFVVAIDAQYVSSKWLYRVTDNIQNLPDLEPSFILNTLSNFRKEIFSLKQYIDPNTSDEHLLRLVKVYDKTDQDNWYVMSNSTPLNEAPPNSPAYITALLLSNPRNLKTVFHQTYNAWKNLVGEVNFDELLILNTIKYTFPKMNQFLLENIIQLQSIRVHQGFNLNGRKDDPLKALHDDFVRRIYGEGDNPINIDCANILMDYLFSGWVTAKYDQETVSQSIAFSETPYWSRINKEYLNEKSIKDQDVLSKLSAFQDNLNLLAEQTVNNQLFALKIKQFGSMLQANEKLILASAVFSKIVKQHKEQACRGSNGFNELRDLIRNDRVRYEEYYQWIKQELEKALPRSFRFVNDLLFRFGRYESDYIDISIYTHCVNLAKQTWLPKTLVDIIDMEFPYSLFHFTVLYSSRKSNSWQNISKKETPYILKHSGDEYHFFPKYWQWLAKILIEGAKIAPKKILPQISYILLDIDTRAIMEREEDKDQINDESMPEYSPPAEWFPDLGELWFGDDFIKLVEYYANFDEYLYQTEEINIRMTFMKSYAKEYLETKRKELLTKTAALIEEYALLKLIDEDETNKE